MEKINIAVLLKDCPTGMELDCTNYDGVVKFDGFNKSNPYAIRISVMHDGEVTIHNLTKYGQTEVSSYNKCIIFPKGKTTWEGFQRPFKDGDVVVTTLNNIAIIKAKEPIGTDYFAHIVLFGNSMSHYTKAIKVRVARLATEEEKEMLFKAIKENGYRWDAETKTLEKLLVPKFKVGDRIRHKTYIKKGNVVTEIKNTYYILDDELELPLVDQDVYELVPDKFDVTTLKPFEGRVLVRNYDIDDWRAAFWGCLVNNKLGFKYDTTRGYYKQCIPYEGNEHLLGKTDECDEYYKTWE